MTATSKQQTTEQWQEKIIPPFSVGTVISSPKFMYGYELNDGRLYCDGKTDTESISTVERSPITELEAKCRRAAGRGSPALQNLYGAYHPPRAEARFLVEAVHPVPHPPRSRKEPGNLSWEIHTRKIDEDDPYKITNREMVFTLPHSTLVNEPIYPNDIIVHERRTPDFIRHS